MNKLQILQLEISYKCWKWKSKRARKVPISDPELVRRIIQILNEDLDPIGVYQDNDIEDEYSRYAPEIANLLLANAQPQEIINYLNKIRTSWMGLSKDHESSVKVAKILAQEYAVHKNSQINSN